MNSAWPKELRTAGLPDSVGEMGFFLRTAFAVSERAMGQGTCK